MAVPDDAPARVGRRAAADRPGDAPATTRTRRPASSCSAGSATRREALGFLAGRGFGEPVGSRWVRGLGLRAHVRARAAAARRGSDDAVRVRARGAGPPRRAASPTPRRRRGARCRSTPSSSSDKAGYCQQFSGAMALLLRMGGVPARVASGFSPGTFDEDRAASTSCATSTRTRGSRSTSPATGGSRSTRRPPSRPARAQLPALDAEEEAVDGGVRVVEGATRQRARAGPERARAGRGGRRGRRYVAVAGRRRSCSRAARPCSPSPYLVLAPRAGGARYGPEVAARELARALRRTGRAPAARGDADAARGRRCAGRPTPPRTCARCGRRASASAPRAPTREQRRALRRELASGLGLRGRLRALWALPPF